MRLFNKSLKKIKLLNIPITAVIQIDKKFIELNYYSDKDYKFVNTEFSTTLYSYSGLDRKFDTIYLCIYNNKMLKNSKVKELLFEYML